MNIDLVKIKEKSLEMKNKKSKIENDPRYNYENVTVFNNAPLALMQAGWRTQIALYEEWIPKVEALEKQNKNTTENLVRAKQILSELREQLEYEQKQNEQLQQEKKELRVGLSLLVKEIEKGDLIEKERTHWFWLKFEELQQLLSKIKE
jgi:soluble cytochrome b562